MLTIIANKEVFSKLAGFFKSDTRLNDLLTVSVLAFRLQQKHFFVSLIVVITGMLTAITKTVKAVRLTRLPSIRITALTLLSISLSVTDC